METVADSYIIETIKSLKGLKSTAEKAIAQVSDDELHFQPDPDSNSVAIIMKHMSGNMLSRFTDFLTTDGEKPWRKRDEEFIDDHPSRDTLFSQWNKGWNVVLEAVEKLHADDLTRIVFIRGEEHTVIRAIHRQLTHYAYHTGQIVYLCKQIKKSNFTTLSIPKAR